MDKSTFYILQSFGVVLSAAAIYFLKNGTVAFVQRWRKKNERTRIMTEWERGLADMELIRDEHMRLFKESAVNRNGFFVAHNGGEIPSATSLFYTSVRQETGLTATGLPLSLTLGRDFRQLNQVDNLYQQMLGDIMKAPYHVHLVTEKMPDCWLKQIYEAEKVAESFVVFYTLVHDGFKIAYASHSRYIDDAPFDDEQKQAILLSANRIRTHFKEGL